MVRDQLDGQIGSIIITAQLTTKQWYIQTQNDPKKRKEKGMREYFTEEFSSDEYFQVIRISETLMTKGSTQNMGCRKDLIYRVFSMLPLKLGFSWVQPTSMNVSILSNGPT